MKNIVSAAEVVKQVKSGAWYVAGRTSDGPRGYEGSTEYWALKISGAGWKSVTFHAAYLAAPTLNKVLVAA